MPKLVKIEDLRNAHLSDWLQAASERGVNFDVPPTSFSVNGLPVADAAIDMQTLPNAGIPAVAATFVDPTIITQLFAPLVATQLYPEVRKGTFANTSALFPRTEEAYEVVAYDDFAGTGASHVNSNWETRTNARYQTMNQLGDLEQERYGLAAIPYVAKKQMAAIDAIKRYTNKCYMYGISGMANFGLINDPALEAALTPVADAAGKTKFTEMDAIGIYNNIVKIVTRVIAKNAGLVDQTSSFKIAVSPTVLGAMSVVNAQFGTLTALDMIKRNYINSEVISVPEFENVVGGLVQVIFSEVGGQISGQCVYSEKMRAYPLVIKGSYSEQKYAAGAYGAVIYHPSAVAQMTGVQ